MASRPSCQLCGSFATEQGNGRPGAPAGPTNKRRDQVEGLCRKPVEPCECQSSTCSQTRKTMMRPQLEVTGQVSGRFSVSNASNVHCSYKLFGGKKCQKPENHQVVFEPEFLNFGACIPHQTQTRTIRVLNRSSFSVRFIVLAPSDPAFQINFNKKGFLAPGMTQEIQIYFSPLEWKLYNTTLKVLYSPSDTGCSQRKLNEPVYTDVSYRCKEASLSAYPELANLKIPSFLNFGVVPLGKTTSKTFEIVNQHPVSFQFAIRNTRGTPDYSVAPTGGDVPAKGAVTIEVTYSPKSVATSFLSFELILADYGSRPNRVDAVGTCNGGLPPPLQDDIRTRKRRSRLRHGGVSRTRNISLPQYQSPHKRSKLLAKQPDPVVYNGVVVPSKDGHAVCNGVFTQHARRKSGELPSLCDQARDCPSSVRSCSRKGDICHCHIPAGADWGSCFSTDSATLKARFEKRWKDALHTLRGKPQKVMVALGELPPSQARNQRMIARRRCDLHSLLSRSSLEDQIREESEFASRPPVVPARWLPRQALDRNVVLDESANNVFALQMESRNRLVCAVTSIIQRNRLLSRLEALKAKPQVDSSMSDEISISTSAEGGAAVSHFGDEGGKKQNNNAFETVALDSSLPLVMPRYTTAQRVLQVAVRMHDVPPCCLVKEGVNASELFKCVEEYNTLAPIPQIDYEIMGLQEFATPNAAWHLEPSNGALCSTLLGSGNQPFLGETEYCKDGKKTSVPVLELDPPIINDILFVTPAASEFRPLIPLPRYIETDLGHCFQKGLAPDGRLKESSLILPFVRKISLSNVFRPASLQRNRDLILGEARGRHNCFGLRPLCASLPYVGTFPETVPQYGFAADQMSDADSDDREDSFDVPVPDIDTYMQDYTALRSSSTPTRGADERRSQHGRGAQFAQATAELANSWVSHRTETVRRLKQINTNLPAELKISLG
ncbi:hypothetical protein BESB_027580 [Besnoitia besnoiti]|uniref:CFAP65 fourth Ig-like domain-containing protein n=1 Tax=Besnoitia besnoiti TaxID=94643 RepID=A0A2A9M6R1_BESBE|nr:uncharacterized protein BESB_027580 [Besnoitia besnoiti]PFH31323.1 hypothetical protein BESB_027580 [Besnoitia besnoiti]